jgi:hypothetical protein
MDLDALWSTTKLLLCMIAWLIGWYAIFCVLGIR